jgi:uncharacterized SAM-binding protein YcdF (DUF218 family)
VRCLRCILLFGLTLLIVVAIGGGIVFWFAADWLAGGDTPRRADVIVVLAGAPERVLYAADLYNQRFAPRVLLSRPALDIHEPLFARFGVRMPREEETSTKILTASGVPAAAIDYFGNGSKSTVDEMEALRARYGGQRLSMLVVTSPLHVRRAALVARDVLGGTGIGLTFVATPYEPVPARWWSSQDSARSVVLEVMKTVFYHLGGRYRASAPAHP